MEESKRGRGRPPGARNRKTIARDRVVELQQSGSVSGAIREQLRARLASPCRCCGMPLRPMPAAKAMRVAYPSIRKFLRGGNVSAVTLDRISEWLQRVGAA
jgi:hypothetical protein